MDSCLGKLPTCEVVQMRYPSCYLGPNWCVICRQEAETQDHLLINFPFVSILWFKAFGELDLAWVIPKTTR